MKRILCAALALCLLVCLAACTPASPEPEITAAPWDIEEFKQGLSQWNTLRDFENYVLLWASYEWPEDFRDEMLLAVLGHITHYFSIDNDNDGNPELQLYQIEFLEGVPEYVLDFPALAQALQGKLTPSGERYLELCALDHLTNDAALVVPYDTLMKRILLWEAFERDHAAFDHQRRAAESPANEKVSLLLMYWYLGGIPNSPVYNPDSGRINPALRESYAAFLADEENKNSAYYGAVREVYGLWQARDWRYSDKLQEGLFAIGAGLPQS
jgi:hypothetical protein